jgi:CRP-like cAMP-binding protein
VIRATGFDPRSLKAHTGIRKMAENETETLWNRKQSEEMVSIQPDTRLERLAAAAAHPLAELLDCPQDAGRLLSGETRCVNFEPGEVVFCQHGLCKGLYVVVSGDFVRKAERFDMRVTLGPARPGDLVELAAALGDGHHTYTLSAVTSGSLLLLPMEALQRSFEAYPPLRMRLLEELAREVSRAYITCCLTRVTPARRHSNGAASR